MQSHYQLFLKYFLGFVDAPKADVCEIGAGDGWAISYNSGRIRSKTVIDIDDTYRASLEGAGITFVGAELGAGRLPVADGSFDLVLLNHVLEHVPDYRNATAEIFRILKKGGVVVIRTPDIERVKFGFYGDLTHIKAYTLTSLQQLLESEGFKTILVSRFSYANFMISFLLPQRLRPPLYRFRGKELLYIGKK